MSTERSLKTSDVAMGQCPTCGGRIDLTPKGNIPSHAMIGTSRHCDGTGKKPMTKWMERVEHAG